MAQSQLTQLTEKQHKQLKGRLWDADRITLYHVLESICDMDPGAAALAYQRAPCKDYEVAEHANDPSNVPVRNEAAEAEQIPGAVPSAFFPGYNEATKINDFETYRNESGTQLASNTAPIGSTVAAASGKALDTPISTTSIPVGGRTSASDQGKMSLASLLQPSPAPMNSNHTETRTEAHVQPESNSSPTKKRKLEHSRPRRLAICRKCGCPYDVHEDENQLCISHPGYMERDEEAWQDIDDYRSVSDRDHQEGEPELYNWSCCELNGEELGCKQGRHSRDSRQSNYARLKLLRGGDQGTDTESEGPESNTFASS